MPKVQGWPPRWLTVPPSKQTDGDRVSEFIETYCRVTKDSIGGSAGELIKIRPWQRELINAIFTLNKDGSYRHRQALVGLPRKSGKSALGSAIALFGLVIGPDGGEIYSCAGDRDQARIVFDTAKRMVQLDDELRDRIKVYRDSMEFVETGSIYRVLSAEASSAEGLSPTLTVFDEVHVQPNSRLWDTMTLGSGARKNSLTLAITTAGVKGDRFGNDSICYQLYQHGQRLVKGEVEDPSFFFSWHEPEKENADWKSEDTWRQANPGFGDLSLAEDFKSVIARTSESEFRTKRLNQWVTAKESAFEQGVFEQLADPDRVVEHGTEIMLGFDGSYTGDSTALVGCTVEAVPHIFVIEAWEKPLDDPNWHVPVLDVEARILQACREEYTVLECVCDPYRYQRTMSVLDEEGIPVTSWPTGSLTRMIPAWQKFYDATIDQEYTHDGDPRLVRHISNMVLKRDARGVRPTKETNTSPRKIDLGISAIIAYDRATQAEPETNPLEYLF